MTIEMQKHLLFLQIKITFLLFNLFINCKLFSQGNKIIYSNLCFDTINNYSYQVENRYNTYFGRILIISADSLPYLSLEYDSLNRRNGVWIYFYKNGNIKKVTNYKKNKQVGKISEYYYNGNLKTSYYLNDESLTDSIYQEWYENGVKKSYISYKNGELQGEYKIWSIYGHQVLYGIFCSSFYIEDCNCIAFNDNSNSFDIMFPNMWYENGNKQKEFKRMGEYYIYYEFNIKGEILNEIKLSKGFLYKYPSLLFYNIIN